jgi:hypothetical protein
MQPKDEDAHLHVVHDERALQGPVLHPSICAAPVLRSSSNSQLKLALYTVLEQLPPNQEPPDF